MLYPPLMLYNLGSDPKPQEQTRLGGYNMLKHTQRGLEKGWDTRRSPQEPLLVRPAFWPWFEMS